MNLSTLLLASFLATSAAFSQAEEKPLPKLAGGCTYGRITQTGRQLSVNGHPRWTAVGSIREDGKVFLIWTDAFGNHAALSVYAVKGKRLEGTWGWADDCEIDLASGELVGDPFDVDGDSIILAE